MIKSACRKTIEKRYKDIVNECAITTASCDKFAHMLFNMLLSLHKKFPNHPKIYVFDLGMSESQLNELKNVSWITLKKVPSFVSHWNLGYTWKPFIWRQPKERFILHLDAGLVILKSLSSWFLVIEKIGYIAFSQSIQLQKAVPADYMDKHKISISPNEEGVCAGVFGFDRLSSIEKVISETYDLAKDGLALGYSESEIHRVKSEKENIIRNCERFRHDQTLLNIAFKKHCSFVVNGRSEGFKPFDWPKKNNKKPFIWNSRRNIVALNYLWRPLDKFSLNYFINRANFIKRILVQPLCKEYFFQRV